jgi:hypothetical protein
MTSELVHPAALYSKSRSADGEEDQVVDVRGVSRGMRASGDQLAKSKLRGVPCQAAEQKLTGESKVTRIKDTTQTLARPRVG